MAKPVAPPAEVCVGLDFGTSATKVVVYFERTPLRRVVGWRRNVGDGCDFAIPSCIAAIDGRLLFGARAEARGGLSSFKVCLACGREGIRRCPRCRASVAQPVTLPLGASDGEALPAEDVCTLYVAHVLGEVRAWMARQPERGGAQNVVVHLAAPLDHLEHRSLERSFLLVLHRALWMSRESRVADGMEFRDGLALLEKAREQVPQPLDPETARGFVVPESSAAMVLALQDPEFRRRLCVSVDVGAGSTDVAFFWSWTDSNMDPVQSYYSTASRFIGVDDMDRALATMLAQEGLAAEEPATLALLRRRKPAAAATTFEWNGASLPMRRYDEAISAPVKGILDHYRRTWATGQRRARLRQDACAELDIVLSGGGSLCSALVDRLGREAPQHGFCPTRRVHRVRLPRALDWDAGIPIRDRDAAGPFLAVAVGLAHPLLDIPRYEVDTPPPPEEREVKDQDSWNDYSP